MAKLSVLFVCLGNICRSPTAEGIFRHKLAGSEIADRVRVDSAGTSGYHVGEAPDSRAQQAAKAAGYDLSFIRARQFSTADFERFDRIIAMDRSNQSKLLAQAAHSEHEQKVRLFLADYAPHLNRAEVPDPYYGGEQGFIEVIELIEVACDGLLKELKQLAEATA